MVDGCPHVSRSFRDAIPAPQRLFYMSHLRIAIRYDFRHWGSEGFPLPMGLVPGSKSRAITNADHAPATFARSRLPWPLERVIALPFKEGKLTVNGAMPFPPLTSSKGKRKEVKAMRRPALSNFAPFQTPGPRLRITV
jgi:hypothetical protein